MEPRLTKAKLLAKNETWANLSWQVDLSDAFTEIIVSPKDIDSQRVESEIFFLFELFGLVPGTSYQMALYPKFGETYGDYSLIEFTTNISDPVIDYLFTPYSLTIHGNLTGRCTLMSLLIEENMSRRLKTCDQPGDIITGMNPMVFFSFEIGLLSPGTNYTCALTITAENIQKTTSVDCATKPEVVNLSTQTVLGNFTTVMNFWTIGSGSQIYYKVVDSSNQNVIIHQIAFENSFTLTFQELYLGMRLFIMSMAAHSGDESLYSIGMGVVTAIESNPSGYSATIIHAGKCTVAFCP